MAAGELKHILFPVDFSPVCAAVVPAVAAMARQFCAKVSLLHALDTHDELPEQQRERAAFYQDKLAQFSPQAFEGLAVERVLLHGRPAEAIVDYARRWHADLIMMPTRGHTRFRQLLLGSVTAGVLHDAQCPVWTSAHAEQIPAAGVEYKRIVCAIDLGARSAGVLKCADFFAAKFGAELHVVHSVQAVDPRLASAVAHRAHAYLIETAQEKYGKLAKELGLRVPIEILEEPELIPPIVRAAERLKADLLVIGRGVIQGFLGRLRSNAHELIRTSPCPVLSV